MAFNDFNTDFFERTGKHIDAFQVGETNYYKVVQDALVRKVQPLKKGISDKLTYPFLLLNILYKAKSFIKKTVVKQYHRPDSKVLFVSSLREIQGKHVYLERLIPSFKDKQPTVVCTSGSGNHLVNYRSVEIIETFESKMFHKDAKRLHVDLNQLKNQLKSLGIFSENEWDSINTGLSEFWVNASKWMAFMKEGGYEKLYLIPGYQTECIILAAKWLGIEVIEIQHGIISNSSRFYLYPSFMKPVSKRALFPDQIKVFGLYWKERLLQGNEFEENQISIIGDYFYRDIQPVDKALEYGNKKLIVMATQQTVEVNQQVDYLNFLKDQIKKNHKGWIIVHQPHPAEDIKAYQKVYDDVLIQGIHPLNNMMPIADIFISIYSTSLYEFSKYNKPSFALYLEDYKEFIDDVLMSGVAQPLPVDENPVLKKYDEKNSHKKDYFFAKCVGC